jgi:hypothetical protein
MSGASRAAPPPYRAPAWLPGGHAQTIWPYFLRRSEVAFRRERVATPDGDFWLFDWLDAKDAGAPLFVRLAELGLAGVVPHFRGCADEPNRLPRAYHSGDHEEIDAMLAAVRKRVRPERVVHACGVSLGGSALLNWLGRRGRDAKATLASAAAVSVPLDLMAAGRAIDVGANRVYAAHFLMTLKPKADAMAARFPGRLDASRIASVRSMWEFDDLVTAPLHGFAGTADYWTRASSKPWLAKVALPTLVLNARNDPFVPGDSLPSPAEVSPEVVLEQPEEGGHVGFATGPLPGRIDWLPQRLTAFFASSGPRDPHG